MLESDRAEIDPRHGDIVLHFACGPLCVKYVNREEVICLHSNPKAPHVYVAIADLQPVKEPSEKESKTLEEFAKTDTGMLHRDESCNLWRVTA